MRQRAIAEDEKLAKRQSILDAAQQLYLQNSRELPSVSRIAEASGLAKGTVYLYFRTKEEIFLALLDEQFHVLLQRVLNLFDAPQTSTGALIDAFLDTYIGFLREEPSFLRLAAMTNSVIEQNLDASIALDFKSRLIDKLLEIGQQLEFRAPQLHKGEGATTLLRVYGLTIGLWQMLDWPDNVKPLLEQNEKFKVLRPDFFAELPVALGQYLGGALLTR